MILLTRLPAAPSAANDTEPQPAPAPSQKFLLGLTYLIGAAAWLFFLYLVATGYGAE